MIATLNILAANFEADAYEDLYGGNPDFGPLINLFILVAIIAAALGILHLVVVLLEWIEDKRKLTPKERAASIEGLEAHKDEVAAKIDQQGMTPCSEDKPLPAPPQARPRRIFTPPPSKFRRI